MDVLTILFPALPFLVIIALLIRLWFSDCDLTLQWAVHFGKSVYTLKGKVVWITGASSGIGEYVAYEMAKVGCKLVLSARREAELERVKKQCLTYGPISEDDILVLPLDCLEYKTHVAAKDTVLKKFGQIDILVNNAGRTQRAPWDTTPIEIDREMFDLNVLGYLSVTKAVLPHMYERNQGQIVAVTSVAGKLGVPFSGSYTGVKHALQGWYSCLGIEAYSHNVHVTIVCPGPVFSDLLQHGFTDKVGEQYGTAMKPGDKRMETRRCAYLMAVGIANQIYEIWISPQPVLIFLYLGQYLPSIAYKIGCRMGVKQAMKLRDSLK